MRGTAPEFAIEDQKQYLSIKAAEISWPLRIPSRGYADLLHKLPFRREDCAKPPASPVKGVRCAPMNAKTMRP
jgi:hypothetical protein